MPLAVQVYEDGPNPEDVVKIENIQVGQPAENECQVEIYCSSMNFPDVLMTQGKYQFKPPKPYAPGGEISGIITQVGSEVKGFKKGDHVLAMIGWGGFAQLANIGSHQLVKVPKNISHEHASALMMTYGTTYHAFAQRAQLKKGETVLVLGASGGVGLAAVELAKKVFGATVIACASTEEKLQVCKQYGADHLINYSKADLKKKIKEATQGNGVDVVYDPVGGSYAEPSLRSMAWKGRYLVIGFASGPIPKLPMNLPLLKGCSVMGVFWGAFTAREPEEHAKNTQTLLRLVSEGKLKPYVTMTYPLKDAAKALRDMMDRKVIGKAIIQCKERTAAL